MTSEECVTYIVAGSSDESRVHQTLCFNYSSAQFYLWMTSERQLQNDIIIWLTPTTSSCAPHNSLLVPMALLAQHLLAHKASLQYHPGLHLPLTSNGFASDFERLRKALNGLGMACFLFGSQTTFYKV